PERPPPEPARRQRCNTRGAPAPTSAQRAAVRAATGDCKSRTAEINSLGSGSVVAGEVAEESGCGGGVERRVRAARDRACCPKRVSFGEIEEYPSGRAQTSLFE